eukprot:SAG11_NODE_14656_length_604_cov_1.019802_1_plen_45_part_10
MGRAMTKLPPDHPRSSDAATIFEQVRDRVGSSLCGAATAQPPAPS